MLRVQIEGESRLEDGNTYRVREYMSERGVRGNGLEWARRECMDRERWRSVCRGHPSLGTLPEGARHQSY